MNPEMMKALEQMQRMQEEMQKVQEQLKDVTTTIEVGGGMVKVTINGEQEIRSVTIEKELLAPDEKEMLEDLIVSAVNRAIERSKEISSEKMNSAASAFIPNIPGLSFPK
jgi:DNA-binding YbaB/EbfC family protein